MQCERIRWDLFCVIIVEALWVLINICVKAELTGIEVFGTAGSGGKKVTVCSKKYIH